MLPGAALIIVYILLADDSTRHNLDSRFTFPLTEPDLSPDVRVGDGKDVITDGKSKRARKPGNVTIRPLIGGSLDHVRRHSGTCSYKIPFMHSHPYQIKQ